MVDDAGRPSGPPISTVVELFADRYTIHDQMSWNGLSLVYRATSGDGRPVAVAVIPLDCEGSAAAASTFTFAARDLTDIRHPGLVQVTAQGIQHGVPFLELEHVDGPLLADVLAQGPVERDRALSIVGEMLGALDAAHGRGAFHWDLTPNNVVLVRDAEGVEHAKVIGVGIAPILGAARDTDRTGPTGKGSGPRAVKYLAPERLIGDPADARADLYSVGVLLQRMLTGALPDAGGPPLPPDVAPIVARALERVPADRFTDAGHMAASLELATSSPQLPIVRTPPRVDTAIGGDATGSAPPPRRSKLPIAVGGAALAAVLAVVGYFAIATTEHRSEPLAVDAEDASAQTGVTETAADDVLDDVLDDAPDDAPAVAESSDAEIETVEAPGAPASGADRLAGPLPGPLVALRGQLQSGAPVDRGEMNAVFEYARDHRDDPRPHLLLARAFMSLRWNSDAIERYILAWEVDPDVRDQPGMLDDLLELIHGPETGAMAAAAIRRIYGAEAIAAIDAALADDPRWDARGRLTRLRAQLEAAD